MAFKFSDEMMAKANKNVAATAEDTKPKRGGRAATNAKSTTAAAKPKETSAERIAREDRESYAADKAKAAATTDTRDISELGKYTVPPKVKTKAAAPQKSKIEQAIDDYVPPSYLKKPKKKPEPTAI